MLFTAIGGSLFMTLKSAMLPQNAFLTAIAGTIAAVWILYGIREGADFEFRMYDVNSVGQVSFKPVARPQDEILMDVKKFYIKEIATDGFIRA
jgi:hypothetical protein